MAVNSSELTDVLLKIQYALETILVKMNPSLEYDDLDDTQEEYILEAKQALLELKESLNVYFDSENEDLIASDSGFIKGIGRKKPKKR